MKRFVLVLWLLAFTAIRPAESLVGGVIAAIATCPTLCEATYVLCCAGATVASGPWAIILAHTACGTAKGICYAACYGAGAAAPA